MATLSELKKYAVANATAALGYLAQATMRTVAHEHGTPTIAQTDNAAASTAAV